jgi:hypothetical protein
VDQTNFCLDQVGTNSPILHFNPSFIVFRLLFGLAVALLEASPSQTRVVQRQPVGTRALGLSRARVPTTVASTAHGLPPAQPKIGMQVLTSPFFLFDCCRMYVHWREREQEAANEATAADPNVMAVLTQCGLVKFFLCPFMHAQPRLLNALVDYWHPDAEAFMIEGQSLVPQHRGYLFFDGPLEERGTR